MNSEFHKSFYHGGERLFSYPLASEQDDTQLATVQILASQRGCAPEDIGVFLEECAPKQWDFARDCATERLDDRGGQECWRILNTTNGAMHTHVGPLSGFAAQYEAGLV